MDILAQQLLEQTTLWLPRVGGGAVVFLAFWILAKIVRRIIARGADRLKLDKHLTSLLARTSGITVVVFGLVSALGTLGIDVSALVAALGLTGFALSFALKDTISNLLSGILILLYRPFETGNRITISGYEGTVVSIDLRYTELEN